MRGLKWSTSRTPGGLVVHERGEWRIESSRGRCFLGRGSTGETGWKAPNIRLYRAGSHVRPFFTVRDAKRYAEGQS